MALVKLTKNGLYCPDGGFYIDPWRPVEKAVITHAHSDHAYPGMKAYLAHPLTAAVMQYRLGQIPVETIPYHKSFEINGVRVSLHPAGHVPGSAQIRLEHKGHVTVVSGDYKVEDDGLSTPFEPVNCHLFISESTFGLPVFQWKPQSEVVAEIVSWIRANQTAGANSLLQVYSLGKAQRMLTLLAPFFECIYLHKTISETSKVLMDNGLNLPEWKKWPGDNGEKLPNGAIILSPSGGKMNTGTAETRTANCSGWMTIRGFQKRNQNDRGFVISDHADWPGLNWAIRETGAEKVWLTHGYSSILGRHLTENGLDARDLETPYGSE